MAIPTGAPEVASLHPTLEPLSSAQKRPRRGVELVTIVMPCRNEERYIRECLDSVLNNGYPLDRLEILVVDGESEDGTRDIVNELAGRYPCVRLLRNPDRIIPVALNLGIRNAGGDVIMRMDAHATYAPGYIERCVTALGEYEADNVGGVWVISPTRSGPMAEAISITLSHPFGIGDAQYRLRPRWPMEVDTVPFGCYRREVFERIGYFNEDLHRVEDIEFNLRLRAAGGRILLMPDAICYYHPRSTLATFLRHNFWNGLLVFYPLRYGRVAFTLRHVIPGLFVGGLIVSLLVAPFWPSIRIMAAVAGGVYVLMSLVLSLLLARTRQLWYLGVLLPVAFGALHLAYGVGTVVGLIRAMSRKGFWRWASDVGSALTQDALPAYTHYHAPRRPSEESPRRMIAPMDYVTIVIPCRNEERYIRDCLDSVLVNGFPLDRLEVLVVDGESHDATRAIVKEYTQRYPCVRLVPNPRRIVPTALNLGIRAARGNVIMRMDAHATYAPGYIEKCVAALREHGADNVGGVWVISPTRSSPVAEAIAITLSHPFGIGDAQYRLGAQRPMEVDTVPFGCYRRELFDRIGYFDENLRRGQDMEFNLRLKAAGGRILLLPDVVCYYHPRSTLPSFLWHSFWNGIWVFYPMRYGRVAYSLRHLIPGVFVGLLLASGLAGLFWPPLWVIPAVTAAAYAVVAVVSSLLVARARRLWRLAVLLPMAFAGLHLTYGVGTLLGLARVLGHRQFWQELVA